MGTLVAVVRWGGVLPGGLLAALVMLFPLHWIVIIGTGLFSDDGECCGIWDIAPESLERLGMAFFVPLTVIYAGSYIAPSARVWTARVLAGLEGLLIVGSLFFIASSESLEYDYEGAMD